VLIDILIRHGVPEPLNLTIEEKDIVPVNLDGEQDAPVLKESVQISPLSELRKAYKRLPGAGS
jgi:hypothetical protein